MSSTNGVHAGEPAQAMPAPSVLGSKSLQGPAPRDPVGTELPIGFKAPAASSDLRSLGVDSSPLPPLSGGTSFGAEFAGVPRTRWKSRSQFVLVLMGYCIGIGNLWRFPYLCGKYGGGAFLVAYIIMLFVVAGPLFFYETVLGQKFQRGPAETFRKMAPSWVGLAYVPVLMTLFYLPYYQMVITYAFHYFIVSFQHPLPWVDGTTPDKYLDEVVLNLAPSLTGSGSAEIHGTLLAESAFVWLVTVLCLVKGIHSAGKAAYVTVILPVIMIIILFFICIRLPGAGAGLYYYLMPRWKNLLRLEVWGLAAGQIIFSLSPGTGTCIALASYHDENYRGLLKDCVFIALSNSIFSLFGGLVVFSVVGELASNLGKPVEEIAASGEGLAFVVFAKGLAEMSSSKWSSVFAVVFFLTLFMLGLDSSFAVLETLQTYVNDWFLARNPDQKITMRSNAIRLILISLMLFLAGLPYTTRAGYYLLEIADHFIVTYSLSVGVFLEYIMIGHFYTAEQLLEDIHTSTGVTLPHAFVWQVKVVAPAVSGICLLLLFFSDLNGSSLGKYPAWAVLLFGIFPSVTAISAVAFPRLQFRMRGIVWGYLYPLMTRWTPGGLAGVRKRAQGGGFHNVDWSATTGTGEKNPDVTVSDDVPLSMHRA